MSYLFASTNDVLTLTQVVATTAQIAEAQGIVEIYVGRVAAQIEDAFDLELLRKATAYQVAYMASNRTTVFEQVAFKQFSDAEFQASFSDRYSPFVAPLAQFACDHLSWRGSHSVSTAPVFKQNRLDDEV